MLLLYEYITNIKLPLISLFLDALDKIGFNIINSKKIRIYQEHLDIAGCFCFKKNYLFSICERLIKGCAYKKETD